MNFLGEAVHGESGHGTARRWQHRLMERKPSPISYINQSTQGTYENNEDQTHWNQTDHPAQRIVG